MTTRPRLDFDNFDGAASELATTLQGIVIDGADKIRAYPTYITLRKFGTECTINAEWTVVFGSGRVLVKDTLGNEFLLSTLKVTISHQSQASDDLELTTNRIKFILACCEAANQLKAAHQDKKVYHLWDTVEDQEKRAQESVHKKNAQIAVNFILVHGKGMRIDTQRSICDGTFSDKLVPGSYEVQIGTHNPKKFTVTVSPSKVVNFTRTA